MTDVAFKDPCLAATTTNITLSGIQTIDGVSAPVGSRVLVKNQTSSVANGIYAVASGAWTRAADFVSVGQVTGGTRVFVTSGAVNASTTWRVDGSSAITIDSSPISFVPVIDAGTVTVRDKGAVADGVTDTRAAFAACDAIGPFVVPRGLYLIASNLTITNLVTVQPGARIVIPTGVTVRFAGGIEAGEYQIFNLSGSGNAGGLEQAKVEWWTGDARVNLDVWPTVECRALWQKAASALINNGNLNGLLTAGVGRWRINGSSPIDLGGASFRGAGIDSTILQWETSATNGFVTSNSAGQFDGFLEGFQMVPLNEGTKPTSGVAINILQSYRTVRNVYMRDPYDGIIFNNIVIGALHGFRIIGAMNRGLTMLNAISDCHVHDGVIEALGDWVTLSGVSGTIAAGDTLTLKQGSTTLTTGQVYNNYGNGNYKLFVWGQKPVAGNTITTSSGGTATIATVAACHQLGGMRWENDSTTGLQEAIFVDDVDILGGEFTWTAYGTNSVGRIGNEGFNRVSDRFYCDTSYQGTNLNGLWGCIIDGWFSSTRKQDAGGLVLFNSRFLRGSPQCQNCAGPGIYVDSSCSDIEFDAPECIGNGRNYSSGNASSTADIMLTGSSSNISIIGGRAGFADHTGAAAPRALWIGSGVSKLKIVALNVPNASVVNNATTDDQTWFAVPGTPNRSPLAQYTNATSDSDAASKGVPVGGFYRNGSVVLQRSGSATNITLAGDFFAGSVRASPNLYLYQGSGSPLVNFAPNTYIMYSSTAQRYYFINNSVTVMSVDVSGNIRAAGTITGSTAP